MLREFSNFEAVAIRFRVSRPTEPPSLQSRPNFDAEFHDSAYLLR